MSGENYLIAGIMALGQIGSLGLLVRMYTRRVDRHDEALPGMLQSLKAISESAEKTGKHLDELFNSRNEHERRIERIEATHDIRGCNAPIDQRWRNPSLGDSH